MDVRRLGATLDDGVGGDDPLTHGGERQIGLGQEQTNVQLRPGLDLEGRFLAVVQKRGREPEPTPMLVHDLGGGTWAGEEAGIEMGQLRDERPADNDARDPRLDGGPRRVERVRSVQFELLVRNGTGARQIAGPRSRQSFATERPPDAARRDGDHEGEDRQQRESDHHRHDEARRPRGVVGPLQRRLLPVRPEHAAEAVDHELDAQQERDHGQGQWWRPEVAAQPSVQHP